MMMTRRWPSVGVGVLMACRVASAAVGSETDTFARIIRLLASGTPAQAAVEAKRALDAHPRSYRLLTALVDAHRALGSSREAAGYLQERLQADPDNAYLHYALGLALQHVEDDSSALNSFRRAGSTRRSVPSQA